MEIVSTCLARDLPIYQLTCRSLRRHLPDASPHVVTRRSDFGKFRNACGSDLQLWDEDEIVPGMTLPALRNFSLRFFPAGAGWYFQQFLKWGFAAVSNKDSHYLIWDADTILLRPLDFTAPSGKPYLTTATEYHPPYFETFENLLGRPPLDRVSFISQHQLIDKSILAELLWLISDRDTSGRGWAWSIMENLRGAGTNLFSEYETYGHFARTWHPDSCVLRELPWTRNGRALAGYPPTAAKLESLAAAHAFAAFESNSSLRGFCVRWLRKILRFY
ncbi:MAG: DUF6492 family protein [Verrucomicrobiota bacterium]